MTKHEEFRRKLWIAVCSGPSVSTILTRAELADISLKAFDERFKEEAPPEDPMVCEGLNPIVGRCSFCQKPVKKHSCHTASGPRHEHRFYCDAFCMYAYAHPSTK